MRKQLLTISLLLSFLVSFGQGQSAMLMRQVTTTTYTTLDASKMGSAITLSLSNTKATISQQNAWTMVLSVAGKSTGDWWGEITVNSVGGTGYWFAIGLAQAGVNYNNYLGGVSQTLAYMGGGGSGNYWTNASGVACGAAYDVNDVINVRWNATAGSVSFYKNGSLQCTKSGLSGSYYLAVGTASFNAMAFTVNFGTTAFTYSPPAGSTGWTP